MKMLKKYFITILLMTAMCSPAFAIESRRHSDTAEKKIKMSVVSIGQASKEAGKTIGQFFKEIGKQTGNVLKDIGHTLRDTTQKELR